MNLEQTISELEERITIYSKELEFSILENANLIVEVGPLTIGTDLFGKVIAQNVLKPTQFTQKAVNEIIKMNWVNGKGEIVKPIVYKRMDWYKERLKAISQTKELLKKALA